MNLRELYKRFLDSVAEIVVKDRKIVLITRKAVNLKSSIEDQ
jgi:hypothetical protein